MAVDLEALEKFYAHHGWIHDEPWKELLSELRALRAERDGLTQEIDSEAAENMAAARSERDGLRADPIGQVKRIAQLTAALKAVEFSVGRYSNRCVICTYERIDGHAPECIVGKALAP